MFTSTLRPILISSAISPTSDRMPLPEFADESSSSSGSVRSIPQHLENQLSFESDRAEKHYRHYLSHHFDDRLTVPLWFPSVIPLGSVGYVRHGQFIKLLDAHHPPLDTVHHSSVSAESGGLGLSTMPRGLPPMPFLDEFASLHTTSYPVAVRNAAERGLDLVAAWTSFIRASGETTK